MTRGAALGTIVHDPAHLRRGLRHSDHERGIRADCTASALSKGPSKRNELHSIWRNWAQRKGKGGTND